MGTLYFTGGVSHWTRKDGSLFSQGKKFSFQDASEQIEDFEYSVEMQLFFISRILLNK
jgi:hypothetical protein